MKLIDGFLFLFPSIMSLLWISGAVWYYWRSEYREIADLDKLDRYREQPVSILIPCFNESKQIVDTVTHALAISQREFEIIAVDDGSTDETPKILEDIARRDSRLHVLNLGSN